MKQKEIILNKNTIVEQLVRSMAEKGEQYQKVVTKLNDMQNQIILENSF